MRSPEDNIEGVDEDAITIETDEDIVQYIISDEEYFEIEE